MTENIDNLEPNIGDQLQKKKKKKVCHNGRKGWENAVTASTSYA
jgi:hypothetical protein